MYCWGGSVGGGAGCWAVAIGAAVGVVAPMFKSSAIAEALFGSSVMNGFRAPSSSIAIEKLFFSISPTALLADRAFMCLGERMAAICVRKASVIVVSFSRVAPHGTIPFGNFHQTTTVWPCWPGTFRVSSETQSLYFT